MPCDLYVDVVGDKEIRLLKQTATKLPMFNQTELQTLRATTLLTQNPKNRKHYEIEFVIVNKGLKPLLGAPSIQILNVMSINNKNIMSLDTSSHTPPKAEDILTRYTDIFTADGKLQEEVHLKVNKDMAPVNLPVRKLPVTLKELLQEELDRLEKMGILANTRGRATVRQVRERTWCLSATAGTARCIRIKIPNAK